LFLLRTHRSQHKRLLLNTDLCCQYAQSQWKSPARQGCVPRRSPFKHEPPGACVGAPCESGSSGCPPCNKHAPPGTNLIKNAIPISSRCAAATAGAWVRHRSPIFVPDVSFVLLVHCQCTALEKAAPGRHGAKSPPPPCEHTRYRQLQQPHAAQAPFLMQ
jgi:hypothetical protein